MRYRVYGNTTVVVTAEVNANSEEDAYEKAIELLPALNLYTGNGGTDKLIGVEGEGQSVDSSGNIEYDDIELLDEDDKDDAE